MIKLLTELYNRIFSSVNSLVSFLIPENAFSWRTLILLGLFSWIMSVPATSIAEILLYNLGWIFVILGIYWGTSANKSLRIGDVPLSIWITGAVTSFYLFGIVTGKLSPKALVIWPFISAVIGALPACLGEDLKLKIPPQGKRKNLAILIFSQLLLSCWFQFYFVVQSWLAEYPSILADDFSQSAFVVQVEYPNSIPTNFLKAISSKSPLVIKINEEKCTSNDKISKKGCIQPRGLLIVNQMASLLETQLNTKPWSQIERNLLPQEREQLIGKIANQAKTEIALEKIKEDSLWQVGHAIETEENGYNLELQAIWQGPRSQSAPHSITKSCNITPVNRPTNTGTILSAKVKCEVPKGWSIDQPIVAMK